MGCCSTKYGLGPKRGTVDVLPGSSADGPPPERFAIKEGTYNVKLPLEKNCTINGGAFLSTGDIVLSDSFNNKLKLFSSKFEYITCLEFQETITYVYASPTLPLVYIVFPDRVRQIHVDGTSMKRSGFIKTPGLCRGICVNQYDGKAISLSITEGMGQVNLLTPGGNLQLEIPDLDDIDEEDEEQEPLFVQPGPLVVTADLNIVVIDLGANSVVGVEPDGEIMFIYKGCRKPSALVCDELNYIYIAGLNCIQQLSPAGELVKLFLTKGEIGFAPLSLSYNQDKKHLLATGKGAKVSVFKMINV